VRVKIILFNLFYQKAYNSTIPRNKRNKNKKRCSATLINPHGSDTGFVEKQIAN
jgi:hypothetical protein